MSAARERDFVKLEADLWAATAGDVGAPLPPPEAQWCTDYPRAIERASVIDDFVPLLALLDAGEPVHPMLLPALADAMRARGRNKASGRKKALVTTEAQVIASSVQMLRQRGKTADDAVAKVADDYGLSEAVVKRAYEARVPAHRRPGWRLSVRKCRR